MRPTLALILLTLVPAAARADATVKKLAEPIPKPILALVATWLEAQNEGRFADYAALYAPGFRGVRRSGPRTVTFDRAGWLKDRERMFKKPMRVSVAGLRAQPGQTDKRIELRFTQFWKSGTYEDVGDKRIVAAALPEGWRLAEEEMLTSTIQSELGPFMRTYGEEYVVLAERAAANWATGELAEGVNADWERGGVRDVDEAQVPARLRALAGARLRLYSQNGALCHAKVGPLRILYRGGLSETVSPKREGDLIKDGARSLVAKLVEKQGCFGELALAQVDGDGAREVALRLRTKPVPDEVVQKAWAALFGGAPAPAPLSYDRCGVVAEAFTASEGGRPVTLLHAAHTCDRRWALFALEGGALKPRGKGQGGPRHPATLAVDLDGDGRLELLFLPAAFGFPASETKVLRQRPDGPVIEDLPVRLPWAPTIFHEEVGC